MALVHILAAAQTFIATIPPGTIAEGRTGSHVYERCTTIVNKGRMVLRLPDGMDVHNDIRDGCSLRIEKKAPVESQVSLPRTPIVEIRVSYVGQKDEKTIARLDLPYRSASHALSGGWVNDPKNGRVHLEGQTISIVIEGDLPAVRYTSGDMRGGMLKRRRPTGWAVEAPLIADGNEHISESRIRIDGHQRDVRLSIRVLP